MIFLIEFTRNVTLDSLLIIHINPTSLPHPSDHLLGLLLLLLVLSLQQSSNAWPNAASSLCRWVGGIGAGRCLLFLLSDKLSLSLENGIFTIFYVLGRTPPWAHFQSPVSPPMFVVVDLLVWTKLARHWKRKIKPIKFKFRAHFANESQCKNKFFDDISI